MRLCTRLLSVFLLIALVVSMVPRYGFAAGTGMEPVIDEDTVVRGISAGSISVPSYAGGTSSGWMTYDCGETVTFHDTGVTSKMRIVTGTSASQFNTYCTKLTNSGYSRVYTKTVPAQSGNNLYGKFLYKDGSHSIYTYFTAAYSQTRIIVDTQNHTVEGFSYAGEGKLPVEIYMYSLSAEESGWGLTDSRRTQYLDNAGSMYVIRMPDNSLYFQDGGSTHQMSERAMEDLYQFCRKITGTSEGERMIISAWCISHGDTDHYRGFTRFIQAYHKDFDLKNVIYNFEIDNGTSYHFRRVTRHFPNVRYYKPHTGEQFRIAGVTFDVLYTTEDRYTPSSSNTLTPHDSSCIPADYLNYNNTSLVFRMKFDGKVMLLTGDIFKADAVLMKMYPASALKADILQIPHHGFDNHTTLAKTVAPQIIFLNQIQSAVLNRERLYTNDAGWRAYAKEIYYGGTEIVGYRADKGVFYRQPFGKPIESLGWSAIVYHIEDKNYQENATPVKDPEPYYRYTQIKELTTTDRTYIIVDDKLNKVLAYDNSTGGVASVVPALYDGEHFYFSSSRRRLVNWLISARSTIANENAAITGSTTYHGGVPIRKGTGGYWGTGTKNSGIYLGMASSYSAEGLHDAWSSFSNQLYAESKATWVDAMADGTFLIYRHGNGTYYPLYRDGDVATGKGWGCTKLTKAQVNSRIDNLRLRMYLYEETASDMYLSWTGHGDFYMEKGVPLKDLLGHISSDIRVNYSFAKFDGGGELPYDANYESGGSKTRGTYWLEFTKTYDPNTTGDYPVEIRYTNAAGATLTIGTLTVHVYARSLAQEPELQQLYFDFGDTDADRDRYELNSQYCEVNFDGSDRWKVTEDDADLSTSTYFQPVVDNAEGTLTATITNKKTTNRALYIQPYAISLNPLNYNPTYAQVVQIRFKMENLKACDGQNPFFRLWYYKGSDNLRKYDRNVLMGKNFVADGEYVTLRFDLYDASEIVDLPAGGSKPDTTFSKAGKITGLRLGFHGFVLADTTKNGSITVDYLYIGPEKNAPRETVTVTFTDEAGAVLQETSVLEGDPVVYEGEIPQMPATAEEHFLFAGWADASGRLQDLSSVTEDLILKPAFTAEAHSYENGMCICGKELIMEPVEDVSLRLNHSLNLASDISVNFLIFKTLLEGFDMATVYVESTIDTYEGNEKTGTTTFRIAPVDNGSYYYFTLDGLTAVQMNDRISTVLYGTKDGQPYYSPVDEYSIATYAYSQMNNPDRAESLKILCADLLRYGSKAQIFKGYRTDCLADTNMTEAHEAYLSDIEGVTFGNTNKVLNDLDNALVTWAGKSLNLESKVALKFVFNPANYAGDLSALTLRISYADAHGNTKTATASDPVLYNAQLGYYVFTVDSLLAAELRAVVSVQIYEGDTPVSATLQYSPDTYGNGKTGTLLVLCKALFAYSDSAKAYFSS